MCKYCNKEFPEKSYGEHLETIHSGSFFRCHECDGCIDRSSFVVHMTLHAVEYAKHKDRKTKRIKQNLDRGPARNQKCDAIGSDVPEKVTKNEHRVEGGDEESRSYEEVHEEFCEPSNVEDFGPLPESVFEAIEDSREYQEVEQHVHHSDAEAQDDIQTLEIKNSPQSPVAEQSQKQRTRSDNAEVHNVKSKIRKCPKCDKVYVASSSYFYHLKYFHNQNKEHECDVCGKKFGTKAGLASHTAIHGGDWRYACRECDKRFRTRASLYIHQQTHSGVKSHRCSRCGRSFRWRTHLRRHETRHLAQKSHVCETCGRGFSVRCDLLRHARTHAAGTHVCDVCGHTFAQLRYLRVHVMKKHSGSGMRDEIKP